ncbi:hypothetical protein [Bacillus kexueae]|nr:hypothetical protein [Bacillus kexueae]
MSEKENGTMAQNMSELKELGKDMEHHRTNQQVKKDGKHPDPKQHETEE